MSTNWDLAPDTRKTRATTEGVPKHQLPVCRYRMNQLQKFISQSTGCPSENVPLSDNFNIVLYEPTLKIHLPIQVGTTFRNHVHQVARGKRDGSVPGVLETEAKLGDTHDILRYTPDSKKWTPLPPHISKETGNWA